jgi:hypothetical protein
MLFYNITKKENQQRKCGKKIKKALISRDSQRVGCRVERFQHENGLLKIEDLLLKLE